jgi:hypothetical protein
MQSSPLIGYRYPFEQADDAAWIANELKPSVLPTNGRVARIDAELLVVLPEKVQPKQVGNLQAVPKQQRYELACSHEQDSSHGPAMGVHPTPLAATGTHWSPACRRSPHC